MAKLNQIIAIEKGIKSRTQSDITQIYHNIQRHDLFVGFAKSYTPKDDEGEKLPPENKRVQITYRDALNVLALAASELFDVTARKDYTNQVAKADVVIDGKTIIKDAPVSFLLFLEKQLTDHRTTIAALPVLDAADEWTWDAQALLYKTAPVQTMRTKKIVKPIVMFPATPEHPAQTQLINEDVQAGIWNNVKHSGAIPRKEKEVLLDKLEDLLKAIKEAREEANGQAEVPTPKIGEAIFGYLLGE